MQGTKTVTANENKKLYNKIFIAISKYHSSISFVQ